MKRFAPLALLTLIAVSAQSQTFTNVSFESTIPGSSATFTSSGNSFTANLTGFELNASNLSGDIAWIYNFDSNPVPAFSAVTIEIGGQTINGVVDILGNEKIFDMGTGTPVQVADGVIDGSFAGGPSFESWTYTQTFVFDHPVTLGQAQKDILHMDGYFGTGITDVNYIKQTFTPVPEPATMAVMGLGVAALIRRRRQNR